MTEILKLLVLNICPKDFSPKLLVICFPSHEIKQRLCGCDIGRRTGFRSNVPRLEDGAKYPAENKQRNIRTTFRHLGC